MLPKNSVGHPVIDAALIVRDKESVLGGVNFTAGPIRLSRGAEDG